MTLLIPSQSKLVMIGDSITDAGRSPDGEMPGDGYVNLVDAHFTAVYPERQIHVVNMGTSGHTVRDLKARWQVDVVERTPDWLSVMIGTNDVWRQFDSADNPASHVYEAEYEDTLTELVERTRPMVQGLVLMTPFYVQTWLADAMRAKMDSYRRLVEQIALEQDCFFVDTQLAFDHVLQTVDYHALAPDRVHPTTAGHLILARAFLHGVHFKWNHHLDIPL